MVEPTLRDLAQRIARLERLAILRTDHDPTLLESGAPFFHDTIELSDAGHD